ncbi:hypothetical protein Lal_00014680, partial [Lupinus albus]
MTLKTKKTKKQSNSKYKNKKNKRGPKAHIGENEIESGRGILRREVRRRRKRENRGDEGGSSRREDDGGSSRQEDEGDLVLRSSSPIIFSVTVTRWFRRSDAVVPTKVNPLTLFHFNLLRYSDAVVPTKLITCLDIPLSVTWNVANTPLLSIAKPDKFIVIKSRYIQFWIQHYIPH